MDIVWNHTFFSWGSTRNSASMEIASIKTEVKKIATHTREFANRGHSKSSNFLKETLD